MSPKSGVKCVSAGQLSGAVARSAHMKIGAMTRPSPAPRFSRSMTQVSQPPVSDPARALAAFGVSAAEVEAFVSAGIVGRN